MNMQGPIKSPLEYFRKLFFDDILCLPSQIMILSASFFFDHKRKQPFLQGWYSFSKQITERRKVRIYEPVWDPQKEKMQWLLNRRKAKTPSEKEKNDLFSQLLVQHGLQQQEQMQTGTELYSFLKIVDDRPWLIGCLKILPQHNYWFVFEYTTQWNYIDSPITIADLRNPYAGNCRTSL